MGDTLIVVVAVIFGIVVYGYFIFRLVKWISKRRKSKMPVIKVEYLPLTIAFIPALIITGVIVSILVLALDYLFKGQCPSNDWIIQAGVFGILAIFITTCSLTSHFIKKKFIDKIKNNERVLNNISAVLLVFVIILVVSLIILAFISDKRQEAKRKEQHKQWREMFK